MEVSTGKNRLRLARNFFAGQIGTRNLSVNELDFTDLHGKTPVPAALAHCPGVALSLLRGTITDEKNRSDHQTLQT
jgi:hypothetical protein